MVEVASCQISSSDASLEKYVARKHAVLGGTVVNKAAGRMSGHVDGFQPGVSESDDVAIVQVGAYWYRFFLQLETSCPGLDEQEMRLCLLTLLGCPYHDIAAWLNKSPESISKMKQRLAAKIGTSPKEMKRYLLCFIG